MAKRVQCLVCGASRIKKTCHIIKLTVEERQALRQRGEEPLDEYIYCKPCWKLISDPVAGPNLLKGLAQAHMRRLGVSNAEEIAQKFHSKLIQTQKKGPAS